MISVLGCELESALDALAEAGYADIDCIEYSSRKGVDGNERRVIRQREAHNGRVELTYSVFKTDFEHTS